MLYQYYVKNSVHNGHLGINSTCFRSKNINFIRLEIITKHSSNKYFWLSMNLAKFFMHLFMFLALSPQNN